MTYTIYSKKDFIKLIKYFIKNKTIFVFVTSLAKAVYEGKAKFESEELIEVFNELCLLLNSFSSELMNLVDLGREKSYVFIKIPLIPADLTRDIDAISHYECLNEKTPYFNISFDFYTIKRLKSQLRNCNFSLQKRVLKNRDYLFFIIGDDLKVRVKRIPVWGFDEVIDYCMLVNNITSNGFILYYDYLNLASYKNVLMKRHFIGLKDLNSYVSLNKTFPSARYPLPLLKPLNLSLTTFTRLAKSTINVNYTPIYGDMIAYIRNVALKLKLRKLASALT